MRRIWLCADDYGISPGVNIAIRDLVVRGRINATSALVVAPSFHRSEAMALESLNRDEPRVADWASRRPHGAFPAVEPGVPAAGRRRNSCRWDARSLTRSCGASITMRSSAKSPRQLSTFVQMFGRPPDYIDGHQHVHLLPQVRDAVLQVAKEQVPNAWLRQCGRAGRLAARLGDYKAFFLDALSATFRRRAAALGSAHQPRLCRRLRVRRQCGFRGTVSALPRRPAGRGRGHVPSRVCR